MCRRGILPGLSCGHGDDDESDGLDQDLADSEEALYDRHEFAARKGEGRDLKQTAGEESPISVSALQQS